MGLRSDSVAGVRFLAAVREGRGIKPAARSVGVHPWTGYRWLREAFLAHRCNGLSAEVAQSELGFFTAKALFWEEEFLAGLGDGRHHLRVRVEVEDIFWAHYGVGGSLATASALADVSRSTGYRWLEARFIALRDGGMSRAAAARQLRLSRSRSEQWELVRRQYRRDLARQRVKAERKAILDSGRHVQLLELPRRPTQRQVRLVEVERRYWELMRAGVSNAAASRLLGMHRKSGTRIRKKSHHQTLGPLRPTPDSGRYLSLRERLQIADLERLGYSIRKISIELGRHPSTVKRELDRNRDKHGRYLPHGADDAARLRRRRPRPHKLVASPRLRMLVQRKLNRYWSPDEICGWLRRTYPTDDSMHLCAETIYRALLLPKGRGLNTRYCSSLRTGRRIRKSRWLTRNGAGGAVTNMTMIDKRPAEVETKKTAGNWEGDLILGTGCASAMVTLRERKTQYGIVINLPHDHTAATVNQAVAGAMAALPRHLKKTLTWDQGTEMARHLELAAATGIDIYFAERSSPWQRGANENFNGLLRQYFPKGTDLSIHSHAHVAHVMEELNTRPRKLLGYRTPKQALHAENRPPTVTFKALDRRPKNLERCNDS
ncbi:MAG TPA: IS30 family transposase [Dermatophilaceae bacterium]|nr:IS30 family transposase [Dermatophilaceae bacterium]